MMQENRTEYRNPVIWIRSYELKTVGSSTPLHHHANRSNSLHGGLHRVRVGTTRRNAFSQGLSQTEKCLSYR